MRFGVKKGGAINAIWCKKRRCDFSNGLKIRGVCFRMSCDIFRRVGNYAICVMRFS